jgi:hypothetical protein
MKKLQFDKEMIIKFAWFHSRRMKGAFQTDTYSDFFVKQSLDIFLKLLNDNEDPMSYSQF